MLLGFDEPACVAAIAFRRAILITRGEKVRIAARKRDGSEILQCGTNPLLMSLLLELVGPVSKHSENLDEQMVATKTKRRRLEFPTARLQVFGSARQRVACGRPAWPRSQLR